ncbi:superoxide dismutase [Candidatus Bathycorpusculum sp.]|jgi:Fe-Mn family superoxide dismutase|uniref:superoxide dismutase n=1 Tax=Candidatus Bathycorpusculum sp. TaxID=2994959 RepID=UPI002822A814|nr:superoxide dismutase [Candidatus Termitimicrobium sp.]MCL2685235.1 superoxide dismutase [Candidatus Termitimicrobium sp.]
MEKVRTFTLPKLPYDYTALAPYISEEQLKIHHTKHHQKYVNDANALFANIDEAMKTDTQMDYWVKFGYVKTLAKELAFNIGGHMLHTIFWENMAPAGKGGGGEPHGAIGELINKEFGSFNTFKKLFSAAAASTEGSGWATLAMQPCLERPIIVQIEKHNINLIPNFQILLAIDVWEHAYYLDYKNERPKFIEAFWNIVNWDKVNQTLATIK